jgi:hypothetical protein
LNMTARKTEMHVNKQVLHFLVSIWDSAASPYEHYSDKQFKPLVAHIGISRNSLFPHINPSPSISQQTNAVPFAPIVSCSSTMSISLSYSNMSQIPFFRCFISTEGPWLDFIAQQRFQNTHCPDGLLFRKDHSTCLCR